MSVRITACTNPFSMQRTETVVVEGITILEALAAYGFPAWVHCGVCLNGAIVRGSGYYKVLAAGDRLTINAMPAGGGGSKNPLRTLLTIAVIAVSAYVVGPAVAGALGLKVGTATYGLVSALAGGVSSAVGMLAVNAIAPPITASIASATQYSYTDSNTYSIGAATNQINQYGPVPILLGKYRITPPYGARPFTESSGNDQYVNMLFCEGHGPIVKTNLRLGETALEDFDDVTTEIKDGSDSSQVSLFPSDVYQDDLSIQLTYANGWQQRTTQPNVTRILLDFTFPNGIVEILDSGKRITNSVTFQVQSKLTSASAWTNHGTFTKTGATTSTIRHTFPINVAIGQYDVRVVRVTGDPTSSQVINASYWTAIRSYQPGWPITEPLTSKTAVRIKATEQLNGTPDNFNCIGSLKCLDYTPSSGTWVVRETTNPASLYRYVLQGPGNKRPKTDSQINLTNLAEFWEHCNDNGFEFSHYVDYRSDIETILDMIAASGRAARGYVDGKIGVIMDRPQTSYAQTFTPRNSWGYKYEKLFTDLPHAFRVKFRNRDKDYREDEIMVYDDGYSSANATKFEELSLSGVISSDLAWKHGRYHIAVARLRPERHTFSADFEHLVCTRGDLIAFQNDVIAVGMGSSRVKSYEFDLLEENIVSITVDAECIMTAGNVYSIKVAKFDGTSVTIPLETIEGAHTVLTVEGDWPNLSAYIPDAGALAMFGEREEIFIELIVKDINPISDLSAELVCIPHAPEIHEADQGTIPPFESHLSDEQQLSPPVIKTIRTGVDLVVIKSDGYIPRAEILLKQASTFSSGVSIDVLYRISGTDDWVKPVVEDVTGSSVIVSGISEGYYYDFRVRFNHPSTIPSSWAYSYAVLIVGVTAPPSDVSGFSINILDAAAHLSWDTPIDRDISHFVLRYSTKVSSANWASSSILLQKIPGNSTSVTVPAMKGTYLIKAVDIAGNESVNAALIVTEIATLLNMNVIEIITEDPSFSGVKDQVEVDGLGYLTLLGSDVFDRADWFEVDNFFTGSSGDSGTYYFDSGIDLGGVYTSRITPTMVLTGLSTLEDVFAREDWFEALDFFGEVSGKYEANLYIRSTNDEPADSGAVWTDWQRFIIGDYPGRGHEFKVVLISHEAGIAPGIGELSIEIDMPDRVIAEDDITVTTAGHAVTFSPVFKALKGVAVSGQDMATGDYYRITSKSETGFTLTFYNSSNAAIERTADYVAIGYGGLQ